MTEETLFHEALPKPPTDRAAFLDRACAGQPALRASVEALLAAHGAPGSVLDKPVAEMGESMDCGAGPSRDGVAGESAQTVDSQPAVAETADLRLSIGAGGVIAGRYTLQQKIGDGGMGEVWLAKQTAPVKRRVALKLIKAGMDSRAVLGRFEQERQALAMMDHPNIARVLDGGMTPTGQPFFVMELVNGLPLNKFCDEIKLTPKERLELFVPICQAVQHAHQKGTVHRDLKPANILGTMIDGKPVPKVIDFGVAKATGGKLTDQTMSTSFGAVVGTLEYMSPEQTGYSNVDVDTRADIYSLGVILYQLLTGLVPIDATRLKKLALVEMIRAIQEEEPARPSTRLSTEQSLPSLAALRQTDAKRLMSMLQGELDWVVMKCLEKRRDRRYETASALSRDIQRYLADEPVEARPPSASYRMQKFVRRNKRPMIAASLVLLALVGGIIGTSLGFFQARSERDAADVARNNALDQKKIADNQRQSAVDNAKKAEAERDAKDKALVRAEGLRLTVQSSAILPSNPGLALLLAVEGAKRAEPRLSEQNDALLAALNQCRELRTIAAPAVAPNRNLERNLAFTAACISHDGRRIASACVRTAEGRMQSLTWDDKFVEVWDANTGKPLIQFRIPGLTPSTIEFSPDDRLILTTYKGAALVRYADGAQIICSDHAARVWDSATGREVAVLRGHTDRIVTAHFSSDGKQIVTASWDKTARVWDAETGQTRAVLQGDRFSLASAMFSADGADVLTVSSGDFDHSDVEPPSEYKGKLEFDPMLRPGQRVAEVKSLSSERSGGRLLETGREFSAARIWDAASGTELHVLGGLGPGGMDERSDSGAVSFHFSTADVPSDKNEETMSAGFSPDGSRVATGSWLGTVKVWDTKTGKPLRSWKGITKEIKALDFSPDGSRLLLVYSDYTNDEVAVWSTSEGKELVRWGRFSTGVRAAHFSPDGRRVLIVPGNEAHQQAKWFAGANGEFLRANPDDRTVYLRDVKSGEDVALFKGHEANVTSAQFNADGSEVVTAEEGGTVRIWNSGDQWQYGIVLSGHSSALAQAAFSPDGRCVMTTFGLREEVTGAAGGERSVRVWNADTGTLLRILKDDLGLKKVPAKDRFLGLMHSFFGLKDPDHAAEITWGEDQILGAVRHAEFSPDGSRLLTVSDGALVRRTDGNDREGSPVDRLTTGANVTFAPVRIWDVASGKKLTSLSGFKAGVRTAALSPDGRRIVTVTDNIYKYILLNDKDQFVGSGSRSPVRHDAVCVWDAQTGRQIAVLLGPDCSHTCGACWSPDGKLLLTAGYFRDKRGLGLSRLQIWDATTLHPVRELHTDGNALAFARQPAFSPDSKHVMLLQTDMDEELVTIWRVDEGAKPVELRGHQGRVNEAAFSPDGKSVVTAANDGTARVWNAATGEQVFMVGDGRNPMHSATFSPDGHWIATASDDSTARVWYADTGREYFKLSGHQGPVFCVAFSPDSQHVVTASGDGTARIWPIDPLPVATSRTPRDLTESERETPK